MEGSRILEVAERESDKRSRLVLKNGTEREHHEFRRIVANVDDEPFGVFARLT